MSETEQNKTEEPTRFKLKKAREKGNVAKGTDLAFFGTLIGLAIFILVFGSKSIANLAELMRLLLLTTISNANEPAQATRAIASVFMPAVQFVMLLGGSVFLFVILMQMVQIRGLIFTTHPLKPDFKRLNPAQGLKRIFSMRTLKEALKNIFKMAVYLGFTYLMIKYCISIYGPTLIDAKRLTTAFYGSGMRLLFMYIVLALIFAALDQVIVRKEYLKQMRMSKSELKREHKDREGEPRMKQKRKQLHAEFVKQTNALGDLAGSDVLIVNPQHFAVALSYDPDSMSAPKLATKGRNNFALMLKSKAVELGIPIIQNAPLARAIYKGCDYGGEIPQSEYQKVADIYLRLFRQRQTQQE